MLFAINIVKQPVWWASPDGRTRLIVFAHAEEEEQTGALTQHGGVWLHGLIQLPVVFNERA